MKGGSEKFEDFPRLGCQDQTLDSGWADPDVGVVCEQGTDWGK